MEKGIDLQLQVEDGVPDALLADSLSGFHSDYRITSGKKRMQEKTSRDQARRTRGLSLKD